MAVNDFLSSSVKPLSTETFDDYFETRRILRASMYRKRYNRKLQSLLSDQLSKFLFEPNDRMTWNTITWKLTHYLMGQLENLNIANFKVVCDGTNNPPSSVDRGELNVDIYIQPVKAVDFIQFNVNLSSKGATLEELGEIRSEVVKNIRPDITLPPPEEIVRPIIQPKFQALPSSAYLIPKAPA